MTRRPGTAIVRRRHASGGGGTGEGAGGQDPRFDTCKEAIAHGYGPYGEGQDPEYGWDTDGDRDGSVCES